MSKQADEVLKSEDPSKAAYDLGYDDYWDIAKKANPFHFVRQEMLWRQYEIGWEQAAEDDREDLYDYEDEDWTGEDWIGEDEDE